MGTKITLHINGTNNRTFCGHKKTEKTQTIAEDILYAANCKTCLWNLTQDRKYSLKVYEELKEAKKRLRELND